MNPVSNRRHTRARRGGASKLVAILCLLAPILYLVLQHEWTQQADAAPRKAFDGWSKPVAALFITGRQHGYLEPCGCTGLSNQKGGLARRHTLLKMFLAKGWQIAPVDVGNQVRRTGVQPEMKFLSTLEAFRVMKYRAVGLGPDDLNLSTDGLISGFAGKLDDDNKSDLFVCANVDLLGFTRKFRILELGGQRIGVTAVLGSEHLKGIRNTDIDSEAPSNALGKVMADFRAANCNSVVVLSHASIEETEDLARQFPMIDVIVTAGGSGEPTMLPERIEGSKTLLLQTGKKGMYVGVVGFFKDTKNPIRYQRLVLDKRFKDSQPMLDILKDYQDNLKLKIESGGLESLGLRPIVHPSGHSFVGSESCGECHSTAYEIWENTPHHHATDSIVDPPERSDIPRHFDPECLSCHVTGWNPQKYFPYKSGYIDLAKSKHLHGSGCENCHGPGSAHVAAENGEGDLSEEQIMELRKSMRLTLKDARDKCLDCHDIDNSPDFHQKGAFEKYWNDVKHEGVD